MHWAVGTIGTPWSKDGEGPDTFHCWSFFRHVQSRHYGRDLPLIPNPETALDQARLFRDHPELERWQRADGPADGDAVQLRCSRHPRHIGVWLEVDGGGVLHCVEGSGVVFQSLAALAAHGWKVEGFYRFKGAS